MLKKLSIAFFSLLLSFTFIFNSFTYSNAASMSYYLRDEFSMQMFYLGSVNYTDTYLTLGSKYTTTLNNDIRNLDFPLPVQNGIPYLRAEHKHILYPTESNVILEAGVPTKVTLSSISNHYRIEFVNDQQYGSHISFRTYVPFDLNYMNYRFKYSDGTYSSSFSLPRSAYRYDSHQGTYTIQYEFLSQSKDVSCIEIFIDFIYDSLADEYYNFKNVYPDGFMDITPFYGGGSQYPEYSTVTPKLYYEPNDEVVDLLSILYSASVTWYERLNDSINITNDNQTSGFDAIIDWLNDFISSFEINSNLLKNFFSSFEPSFNKLLDFFEIDKLQATYIDDSNEFFGDNNHILDDSKELFTRFDNYYTDLDSTFSNVSLPASGNSLISSISFITNQPFITRIIVSVFSVATLGYVFFGKK